MNRRRFLACLGLAPFLPLLAKIPGPKPIPVRDFKLNVTAYEGDFHTVTVFDPANYCGEIIWKTNYSLGTRPAFNAQLDHFLKMTEEIHKAFPKGIWSFDK